MTASMSAQAHEDAPSTMVVSSDPPADAIPLPPVLDATGRPWPVFAHASEAEMARILDFYAVRWDYEPRTFPILWNLDGAVIESFSPDFYLSELDLYLEMTTLKQRLVRKKNRKLRRLRELYPAINIKLFYARDFRAMLLKYGRLALVDSLSGTLGQISTERPQADPPAPPAAPGLPAAPAPATPPDATPPPAPAAPAPALAAPATPGPPAHGDGRPLMLDQQPDPASGPSPKPLLRTRIFRRRRRSRPAAAGREDMLTTADGLTSGNGPRPVAIAGLTTDQEATDRR